MRRRTLWFLALLALVLVAMGRLARPVAAAPTTTVGDDLRDVVVSPKWFSFCFAPRVPGSPKKIVLLFSLSKLVSFVCSLSNIV